MEKQRSRICIHNQELTDAIGLYIPTGWHAKLREDGSGIDLWLGNQNLTKIIVRTGDTETTIWGTTWSGSLEQVLSAVVSAAESRLVSQ